MSSLIFYYRKTIKNNSSVTRINIIQRSCKTTEKPPKNNRLLLIWSKVCHYLKNSFFLICPQKKQISRNNVFLVRMQYTPIFYSSFFDCYESFLAPEVKCNENDLKVKSETKRLYGSATESTAWGRRDSGQMFVCVQLSPAPQGHALRTLPQDHGVFFDRGHIFGLGAHNVPLVTAPCQKCAPGQNSRKKSFVMCTQSKCPRSKYVPPVT